MDALLMCGGRGTRLDADVEKPLYEIGGVPMVERVLAALRESRIDRVRAVCSPHAPATREHVDCPVIEAPGDGYVVDLQQALERVEPPVLTVAADLPLLSGAVVDAVLGEYGGEGSVSVAVPAALKRTLGVSVDTTWTDRGRELAPTGLNVVDRGKGERAAERTDVRRGARLAVNVNRPPDAQVAARVIAGEIEPVNALGLQRPGAPERAAFEHRSPISADHTPTDADHHQP